MDNNYILCSIKSTHATWVQKQTLLIPALGRLRQEDIKVEDSLCYIVKLSQNETRNSMIFYVWKVIYEHWYLKPHEMALGLLPSLCRCRPGWLGGEPLSTLWTCGRGVN